MNADAVAELFSLLDWKRNIGELYADVRATPDKHAAWRRWRDTRARLFRSHPQSPIPPPQRQGYAGPYVYEYDPTWCLAVSVEPVAPGRFELRTSKADTMAFGRVGLARF